MIHHLTVAGAIHAALAILCIGAGLIQFLRPKRGAAHRALGYFYVYAMLVADGTAMLVYRFTGHFNLFHVAAIINFVCVVLAVVPLLRSPRPANWRRTHYSFISWSYVSPLSAAATEIVARLGPVTTREQVGLVALVVSLVTMTVAFFLIGRHRPPAEAALVPAKLAEPGGVPS
jgi:uncharacterized membrane protein